MHTLQKDGVGDVRGRQASFNASSRLQWDTFASHRQEVMSLLGDSASRVCVMGVGNGNDLVLPTLLNGRREVHLVDIDRVALSHAVSSQGVDGHPALRLHHGVDVTGLFDVIAGWSPLSAIGPAELSALSAWPAGRVAPTLPGPFGLVASTCILSQLMETACNSLGPNHPKVRDAETAIRDGHLRLLVRLAAPGGTVVLVTEVTSTRLIPGLNEVADENLSRLVKMMEEEGKHYRAVLPSELMAAVRRDRELSAQVTHMEPSRPWRWRLHDRTYLVMGMTLRIGLHARR